MEPSRCRFQSQLLSGRLWASHLASLNSKKEDTLLVYYYLLSYALSGDRYCRKPDWREETFPSKVLLISLPALQPVTQGSSESPVLRTKTQGASSGMYTSICRFGQNIPNGQA